MFSLVKKWRYYIGGEAESVDSARKEDIDWKCGIHHSIRGMEEIMLYHTVDKLPMLLFITIHVIINNNGRICPDRISRSIRRKDRMKRRRLPWEHQEWIDYWGTVGRRREGSRTDEIMNDLIVDSRWLLEINDREWWVRRREEKIEVMFNGENTWQLENSITMSNYIVISSIQRNNHWIDIQMPILEEGEIQGGEMDDDEEEEDDDGMEVMRRDSVVRFNYIKMRRIDYSLNNRFLSFIDYWRWLCLRLRLHHWTDSLVCHRDFR